MKIILHFPSDQRTITRLNVESFETEFGDKNTVRIELTDGTTIVEEGVGLTVSAATIEGDR